MSHILIPLDGSFEHAFATIREGVKMAKAQSGKSGKPVKIVTVSGYTKKDGTKVEPHKRSTPN